MQWGEVVITFVLGMVLGVALTVLVVVACVTEFWKELLDK